MMREVEITGARQPPEGNKVHFSGGVNHLYFPRGGDRQYQKEGGAIGGQRPVSITDLSRQQVRTAGLRLSSCRRWEPGQRPLPP